MNAKYVCMECFITSFSSMKLLVTRLKRQTASFVLGIQTQNNKITIYYTYLELVSVKTLAPGQQPFEL